jgi:hypothetical protein
MFISWKGQDLKTLNLQLHLKHPKHFIMVSNKTREKKIFVLDTSVILYNHSAIRSFEDNDVAIPITVLEELDNFKKGNDTINFEAREFIRIIDKLSAKGVTTRWTSLGMPKGGRFKVVMNEQSELDAVKVFGENKPDHRILNAALVMIAENPGKKVVLVSKDVNLRLKAQRPCGGLRNGQDQGRRDALLREIGDRRDRERGHRFDLREQLLHA